VRTCEGPFPFGPAADRDGCHTIESSTCTGGASGYLPFVTVESVDIAAEAGLCPADLDRPGLTRRRRGSGFSYHGPRGGRIDPATKQRIEELAIPPAWTDVWISPDDGAHILAAGLDDAGRRQYLYHPRFREVADEVKYARVGLLGHRIIDVRRTVTEAIGHGDDRARLVGIVVRLIDRTLMRVGTERYADENDVYGASTLRTEHAAVDGSVVTLRFEGKGGREHRHVVDDQDVVEHVRRRQRRRRPRDVLFATEEGWTVDGTTVADWLSTAARLDVTAKDLRTFGASATMVRALGTSTPTERDPVVDAYDTVAERLGNTRAVARDSYVAPHVVAAHRTGRLGDAWATSRASAWRRREESVLTKLLAQ